MDSKVDRHLNFDVVYYSLQTCRSFVISSWSISLKISYLLHSIVLIVIPFSSNRKLCWSSRKHWNFWCENDIAIILLRTWIHVTRLVGLLRSCHHLPHPSMSTLKQSHRRYLDTPTDTSASGCAVIKEPEVQYILKCPGFRVQLDNWEFVFVHCYTLVVEPIIFSWTCLSAWFHS